MSTGIITEKPVLYGTINETEQLRGNISATPYTLTGIVSVSVRDVPYYETSNAYGGTTVYIGKEVVSHGL